MRSIPCLLLAAALASSLAPPSAAATAQRTFVAASGTNNPACSLVAPCRDFASAITATSAGGEIIVLESGGYGAVTIGKTVSIVASPGIYAGISVFSGSGVTINAPGATVVLRGLSINGQGGSRGIDVQAAARVRIENCVVSHMATEGISDVAAGSEIIVIDTIVRDNGGSGIVMNADASIVLDHVRSEHNGVQGFAAAPATSDATATVSDSVFVHNVANGVILTSGPSTTARLHVERSVLSNNGGAGFFAFASASGGSAIPMLDHNAIAHNVGPGVLFSSDDPGVTWGFISNNAIYNNGIGVQTKGTRGLAIASANTVALNHPDDVHCDADLSVLSMHNNSFNSTISPTCVDAVSGW
jgi:hypothetical protein